MSEVNDPSPISIAEPTAFAGLAKLAPGFGLTAAMPRFVLGFLAPVAVNSLLAFPPIFKAGIGTAPNILLFMVLAAMGLEADTGKLSAGGFMPFLLGIIATLFIAGSSLLRDMLAG